MKTKIRIFWISGVKTDFDCVEERVETWVDE